MSSQNSYHQSQPEVGSIAVRLPWGIVSYVTNRYQIIDSTNSEGTRLSQILPNATRELIIADTQLCGRGRVSRTWVSSSGNLHFSLLLNKSEYQDSSSYLPFIAAISLKEASGISAVKYKWPNDLLINEKKLSGILIETGEKLAHYIIGIGVNITVAPLEKSCKLNDFTELSKDLLLTRFLHNWELNLEDLYSNGFQTIKQKWLKDAAYINQIVSLKNISGTFTGIDDGGKMVLVDENHVPHCLHSLDLDS